MVHDESSLPFGQQMAVAPQSHQKNLPQRENLSGNKGGLQKALEMHKLMGGVVMRPQACGSPPPPPQVHYGVHYLWFAFVCF